MRGEYDFRLVVLDTLDGSPPHAWGIPRQCRAGVRHLRFTPTCVGNTATYYGWHPPEPVHPHMRGEYGCQFLMVSTACGSPPHAWGILADYGCENPLLRFTPTCVGNTSIQKFLLSLFIGSPPHAWGIPDAEMVQADCDGFTPTCVGNTSGISSECTWVPVHPHMRGEYSILFNKSLDNTGSPPHAWGIRLQVLDVRYQYRFTPTCVGNTPRRQRSLTQIPVHPHMRGEYDTTGFPASGVIGSPPHAWGIRWFVL